MQLVINYLVKWKSYYETLLSTEDSNKTNGKTTGLACDHWFYFSKSCYSRKIKTLAYPTKLLDKPPNPRILGFIVSDFDTLRQDAQSVGRRLPADRQKQADKQVLGISITLFQKSTLPLISNWQPLIDWEKKYFPSEIVIAVACGK